VGNVESIKIDTVLPEVPYVITASISSYAKLLYFFAPRGFDSNECVDLNLGFFDKW